MGAAVGYLGYYAAWLALSYVIRQPWLLVGLVALWLLRGVLPGPSALFGALSRAGRLRQQVQLNRANVTARRDLATIYLDLLRPRRALELLEEGLALSPEDPELLYLSGVALHRAGRHDDALGRLLSAIEKDSRLRHGQPYFVAGETLLALKRWDDATDAFERYQDFNSSDVAAHTALARAHAGAGDAAAAQKWLLAGLTTWHGLPGSLKRRQFGAYLRAQGARVTVLKQPHAIVAALALVAVAGYGAKQGAPLVAKLWEPSDERAQLQRVREATRRCGTVATGEFEGRYRASFEGQSAFELRIEGDRLVWPRGGEEEAAPGEEGELTTEYCLSRLIERKSGSLHAEALFRVRPSGGASLLAVNDAVLFDVRLNRGSELTRLRLAPVDDPASGFVVDLERQE